MTKPQNLHITATALACLLSGCLTKLDIIELDASQREPDGGAPPPAVDNGGLPELCMRGGYCDVLDQKRTDTLDLLLVVDNAPSMQAEQAALTAQLPKLVAALRTGMRTPDDAHPFVPPLDMHFGVITSDLGVSGVDNIAACDGDGGDGAHLQHTPHGMPCDEEYPAFLMFNADQRFGPVGDADKLAADLACIVPVGTEGCGIRQPLEATLKGLWPEMYFGSDGMLVEPNPIEFLSTTPDGKHGLGDVPAGDGGSRGFLRKDVDSGLSLLSVLVVSNADDCSMRRTDGFHPEALTTSGEVERDINLRCFHNKSVLHEVVDRYVGNLQKLRPTRPDLVTFNALVGVPTDLVDDIARSRVDMRDEGMRNAYYDTILNDPRMQEAVDPATNPGTGTGSLKPSCVRAASDMQLETAFPPRRIVEVAKSFGANSMVQSICQDDFGPAMEPILDNMAAHFGGDCLEKRLKRGQDGKVACDVIWQLPVRSKAGSAGPTKCNQASFLRAVSGSRPATRPDGGKNCLIEQVAVTDTSANAQLAGEGWYYDNFSDATDRQCPRDAVQRIAYTASAKPPSGVKVVIDCETSAITD